MQPINGSNNKASPFVTRNQLSSSLPEMSPFSTMFTNEESQTPSKGNKKGAKVFLIGVAGGTASGKTSVCKLILQNLSKEIVNTRVQIISQDSFYKPLDQEQRKHVAEYNFDHPGRIFSKN